MELKKVLGVELEELETILVLQGYTLGWLPKFDGTNIQIFVDDDTRELRAFTLGSLDSTQLMIGNDIEKSPTYQQKALSLLSKEEKECILQAPIGCSFIFELCSRHNPIVTQYREERMHAICDINDAGIPIRKYLPNYIEYSEKGAKDMIHKMQSNSIVYGENIEGVVLWAFKNDYMLPIAKTKLISYLNLHKLTNRSKNRLYNIQRLFLEERTDDLELKPEDLVHLQKFKEYLDTQTNLLQQIQAADVHDRKEFAALVNDFPKLSKWIKPDFLFLRVAFDFFLTEPLPSFFRFFLTV